MSDTDYREWTLNEPDDFYRQSVVLPPVCGIQRWDGEKWVDVKPPTQEVDCV